MIHTDDLKAGTSERPAVMTIGVFDGVHRGHQHLIGSMVARAREMAAEAVVLTFDPHPDLIIRPDRELLLVTSLEERLAQIAVLGVDRTIIVPFTNELKELGASEFMARICAAVPLRELWVGWDFALGRRREGTLERLTAIGREFGYSVHPVDRYLVEDGEISSTAVRAALAGGDVAVTAQLLGRPFSVTGLVVEGDRRGRTIGFPTANIACAPNQILPANGVYVCTVVRGAVRLPAVTNIGVRPTFDGTRRMLEAHLLDFSGDLYGETLRLEFHARLRGEQKFDGIAALIAQITRDAATARAWFAEKR
ncbi:MAG TPA: bifunctional riboflavin kinase/FAD synthetase [Roseiflexaceae bacterium]|nr:bifunctional riboflavin kinase/FAD synthetase [Roseiflexaceae bacterium]HMP40709.1 bifunctional riboflavin kinase/FAD synthetase [Roseiflexaceae bacterium]